MVGNVGQLVIFFFTLVSAVIAGLFTLTYAARCFLTIVEDTAAGNDEIRWPDEPPTDWYGKPFFLGWLLLLPIVPASLVILCADAEFAEEPLGRMAVLLAAVWLLFPLCLLSSLAASTSWLIVHLGMYRRVFRHPGILGLFYMLTAPILVIGVALVFYGITSRMWILLPVAAITGSGLLFIYSRLLGRVAWLACQGLPIPKKKKQKRLRGVETQDPWGPVQEPVDGPAPSEEIVAAPPKKPKSKPTAAITAVDPWALPKEPAPPTFSLDELEAEDEWAPNKKPYGLASSAAGAAKQSTPPPIAPRPQELAADEEEDEWTPNKKPYALKDYVAPSQEKSGTDPMRSLPEGDEDEWTPNKKPYSFQAEEERQRSRPQETHISASAPPQREERIQSQPPVADAPVAPPDLPKPSRLDMQIYLEPYQPFVPRWTLFSGVWEFPLYALSARPLVYLSAMTFVLGSLIRALLLLWPF